MNDMHAFDFDPQSVACTRALRECHAADSGQAVGDSQCRVDEGSVLDRDYPADLGRFGIV